MAVAGMADAGAAAMSRMAEARAALYAFWRQHGLRATAEFALHPQTALDLEEAVMQACDSGGEVRRADAGCRVLFKGCPIVWDEAVPVGAVTVREAGPVPDVFGMTGPIGGNGG